MIKRELMNMIIHVNYLALVQRLSQLLKVIVPDQPMQWVVCLDLCPVHSVEEKKNSMQFLLGSGFLCPYPPC